MIGPRSTPAIATLAISQTGYSSSVKNQGMIMVASIPSENAMSVAVGIGSPFTYSQLGINAK
jgi:hypothetical protein